jgi:hypothetical protein
MGFFDWLRSAPSITPPEPPAPERGPEEDPVDDTALHPRDADGDGIPDAIAGICVSLEYSDAIGEISTRRVIVDHVYVQGDQVYIDGLCLLRNAQRTFRGDRILKLLLPPDWKEVADPVTFLESYALPGTRTSAKRSPERTWVAPTPEETSYWERRYKVRSAANHGLRVLTFMARVDGAFVLKERQVLNSYVKDIGQIVGVPLSEKECADISEEVESLFPTKRQVANSLAAIRMYQEQASTFLKSLNKLVRSDGTVSSWEQNAMRMLIDILKKQTA